MAGFDAHLIEEQVPRSTALHARLTDGGRYIVPLTSQNQAASEADLREFVQAHMDLDDAELTRRCGQAIRNYDPRVSCSAHFLDPRSGRHLRLRHSASARSRRSGSKSFRYGTLVSVPRGHSAVCSYYRKGSRSDAEKRRPPP